MLSRKSTPSNNMGYTFASHSSSKVWLNPHVQNKKTMQRLNDARWRYCRNSAFWTQDFDIEQHRKDLDEEKRMKEAKKLERQAEEVREKFRLGTYYDPPVVIKEALGGKVFGDNHSAVLARKTVFTHEYQAKRTHEDHYGRVTPWLMECEKQLADWPSRSECKYEGDDRLATDDLHRRCLCLPRVSGNETVNWQQRSTIHSYSLEDFYFPVPDAVDMFIRTHHIPGREIDDEVGTEMLGEDLMEVLDE